MSRLPLTVLLLDDAVPEWLGALTERHAVGVLSTSADVIGSLQDNPRVYTGLLDGVNDLHVGYAVLRRLTSAVAADSAFSSRIREICLRLSGVDLFTERPRLAFLPPMIAPEPHNGRAAAYLLNRLGNNVGDMVAAEHVPADAPQLLKRCYIACMALSMVERQCSIPKDVKATKEELDSIHTLLLGNSSDQEKYEQLIELGRRLSAETNVFLTIPAPGLADKFKQPWWRRRSRPTAHSRAERQVRTDYVHGRERRGSATEAEKQMYTDARRILTAEESLLVCQSTWLASASRAMPIQTIPLATELYGQLTNLHQALKNNTSKVAREFRKASLSLSAALPANATEQLAGGFSPVTFFSDLPFEWTAIGKWPVCLTRPVSRVPISMSHWDTLVASVEAPVTINVTKPERVLVLSCIEETDPIRQYSDMCFTISNALGQRYTYKSPRTRVEFVRALHGGHCDVVVLDAHGRYSSHDVLEIMLGNQAVELEELLIGVDVVPPVWILSACHTSVPGAITGSFVRALLARGGYMCSCDIAPGRSFYCIHTCWQPTYSALCCQFPTGA